MRKVDADKLIRELGIAYFNNLSIIGALSDKAINDLLHNGQIL